jgi:hypothetical protein
VHFKFHLHHVHINIIERHSSTLSKSEANISTFQQQMLSCKWHLHRHHPPPGPSHPTPHGEAHPRHHDNTQAKHQAIEIVEPMLPITIAGVILFV